jgi:anti-sigma B factor antagonist
MEYEAANVKVRHYPRGEVDVIEIKGEMTAHAELVLFDVLHPLLREGRKLFVLDVSNMTYANSSGIGLFVTMLIRVNRNHGRLAFAGPSKRYTNIFQIDRLDDAIPIFPTVSEAVAELQKTFLPPPPQGQ